MNSVSGIAFTPQRAVAPRGTHVSGRAEAEVTSPADGVVLSDAKAIAGSARPGSLWVVDQHLPPPSLGVPGPFAVVEHFVSHGQKVIAAARQSGFQGPIGALEVNDDLENLPFADDLMRQQQLWQSDRPEDLRESLRTFVCVQRKMTLHDASKKLEQLCEAGVRQSAVNLSLGSSQAESVQQLLAQVTGGDSQTKMKFIQAFELDISKLSNPDPAISGAERVRLHQQFFALAASVEQDPGFVAEKNRYDQNVARFEAGHNSVVVAATNSGQLAELLQEHALGTPSPVPAQAFRNDLCSPLTTNVGAAQNGRVADYSADFQGLSLYADGSLEFGGSLHSGTSLAAPRVAAALAQIHGQQPELSSEAVELQLKQRLARLLGEAEGKTVAPVLE